MIRSLGSFRQLKTPFWLCLLMVMTVDRPLAASNDELLQTIERLEARIKQLESKNAWEITDSLKPEPTKNARAEPGLIQYVLSNSSATETTLSFQVVQEKVAPEKVEQEIASTPPPVPPFELIPSLTLTRLDGSGDWALFLNIGVGESDQTSTQIVWEDVRKIFRVQNELGKNQELEVVITMRGDGERKMIGRSLLFQPRYEFRFQYRVEYRLLLDGKALMSAEKFLFSTTLEIDKSGKLPIHLFNSNETHDSKDFRALGLEVQFGCDRRSDSWENSNLKPTDSSFSQLNLYACLLLDFAD